MSGIQHLRHYINGRFIEGTDHHVVSNPANGKLLAYSPQASAQEVVLALAACHAQMGIMRHEIFGPVLPIPVLDGLEQAIILANDSEYGLTSSVYTRDLAKAMQAMRALDFGETYINRENFAAMQGFHAGVRKSGIGGADGKHGLYEYAHTQVVYLQA